MVKSISHVRTRISSDTFFTVKNTKLVTKFKVFYLHVLADIIIGSIGHLRASQLILSNGLRSRDI